MIQKVSIYNTKLCQIMIPILKEGTIISYINGAILYCEKVKVKVCPIYNSVQLGVPGREDTYRKFSF